MDLTPTPPLSRLDYPPEVLAMLDAGLDLFVGTYFDSEIGTAPAFIKVRLDTALVSELYRLMNSCVQQDLEDLSVLRNPASWDRRHDVEDCTWKLRVDRTGFSFEGKSRVAFGDSDSSHVSLTYLMRMLKTYSDGLPIPGPNVAFYGGACFLDHTTASKLIDLVLLQHPEVEANEVAKRMGATIAARTLDLIDDAGPAIRPRRAEI